jgi:very-short-patch-repair endonuclease
MNIFEKQLFDLLKQVVVKPYRIEPQYVVGGRFTVDFALLSEHQNIAVELDGAQHEIIGGLPVFEDKQRDAFLGKEGWKIVRIPVHALRKNAENVMARIRAAQEPE